MTIQKTSCPSEGILKEREKSIGIQIFPDAGHIHGGGKELVYSLAHLRSFLEERGYLDYLKHPHQIYLDLEKKPDLYNCNVARHALPKVFQSVWITNPKFPRPIKSKDLNSFFSQAKKLEGYKKVIWTNIEPDLFREIHKKDLASQDITIQNIANLKTNYTKLLDFLISPEMYVPHFVIEKSLLNGVFIDLAKYLVMEAKGGVLADFNFYFVDDFNKSNIESYDFIAQKKSFTFIENGFFVAKPHHIIFTEVLEIMYDLLIDNSDCGMNEYRDLLYSPKAMFGDYLVYRFTMEPLFMAYLKFNNQENNVDALMYRYDNETMFGETSEVIISKHDYFQNNADISHEEHYKLYSDNFNDLEDYATAYWELLYPMVQYMGIIPSGSLLEQDLVGRDTTDCSWHQAGITG